MTPIYGPQTQAAEMIDAMKYRERGEDFREAINRVAFGLKDRGRSVRDKYLALFPNSTPDEVRGKMIAARKADIRVFEHIIADYETKLQQKEG